jgi:uncharacterized membrane protein YeaQ/YmgE (transglycosylase-associated protein family)
MINLTIWLVAGSAIGWFASVLMRTATQRGIALNMVSAVAGAVIAGWMILPVVGAGTINQSEFSFFSLIIAMIGAVAVLAAVKFVRPGTVR